MAATTSVRSVPFFDYPGVFAASERDFVGIFRDVCRRGAFIKQNDLAEFERDLCAFLDARYILGVGNATDGLHVALRAAGIGPGDEVIFCSHTMLATASAIYFAGATPVPVECGPDHLISADAVEAAVTPRTRAIMPTQLNGRTADMGALQAIADRHGLLIVEDAAQALGSRFRRRLAGTFGIAGVISFYPAKVLGCFGDGGAIVTNDPETFERAASLCDFGRNSAGDVVRWGLNSRLDNLQAAILAFQLKRYHHVMERRRRIAAIYQQMLGDVAELTLPPAPDSDPDHFDIYQNYEIEGERRDELKQFLKENGIGTLIQWNGKPVHQCVALGFRQKLPYTDRLFTRMLLLPIHMTLADDDVHYVCDNIRSFYGYSQ
jgi:dTDP-4-amino-4,6-dideoxygalactose transaminase